MVGRDTVTFRFRLDAKEMQRLIKALEADARRMGATMDRVKGQSDRLGDGLGGAGRNSAAAAVNFQTATQGLMNLGTAAAQTFTSVSNLDRAANRLAQANLGVARSTDLMNNKELRLDELRARGLGNSKKAALLTNEIATARADLAIKTDKARIEEGALLDIQILFATNIANVMVSSIQTIKSMRDMQAVSAIRAGIAESGLIMKMKGLILAQRAVSLNAVGTTAAFKGMTIGIKGMTFSVRGLMLALGPIAILIGGVTLAMTAYEENWGGFKDAMQSALPFLKETNSDLDDAAAILEQDRIAMEGYAGAVDGLTGSLKDISIPHRNYLEMMAEAATNLGNNTELAKQYTDQLGKVRQAQAASGFSPPSFAGGQVGTGVAGTSSSATASGVSNAVSHQPTAPQIPVEHHVDQIKIVQDNYNEILESRGSYNDWYANHASKGITWSQYQSQHKTNQNIQDITNLKFTPSPSASIHTWTGPSFNVAPHPFGTPQQRNAFNFLPKKERETMALELFNEYQASDDPAVFMMSYQASDLIDSIKNEKSNDIKGPADSWKDAMKKTTGFGDVDNVLLSDNDFVKNFKNFTQQEGLNQYRIDLDTPDVLTGRTQRASFTANVNRLRKISAAATLKNKLEQVKNGLLSPFGMSGDREVSYGGSGGHEILRLILGTQHTENRSDSLLNGMVNGMLSNIGLFSTGSVESERLNIMGNQITSRGRVGESSVIDTLRHLQVESLLKNNPNAFTKTNTNLARHTQSEFDNQEGNVSDMSRFLGQVTTPLWKLKRNATTLSNFRNRVARGNSFVNGRGGLMLNAINIIKGGRMITSSAFRSMNTHIAEAEIIQKAVQMGIKSAPGGWMDMVAQVPEVNIESEDNMSQALSAMGSLASIASQYISRVEGAKSAVGFTSSTLQTANMYGFSGVSLYHNIILLSNTKRTNFSNTEIAEESKNKLNLTNSQTFAIRFNATRGDTELQDRFRYVDQLEAMSSGTSPL